MIVIAAILAAIVFFAAGAGAGAYVVASSRDRLEAEANRWFRAGLSRADVNFLLKELVKWAEKYAIANPSGRYLKRREADLYWAVDTIGINKLRLK